jgi:hypothetical protein
MRSGPRSIWVWPKQTCSTRTNFTFLRWYFGINFCCYPLLTWNMNSLRIAYFLDCWQLHPQQLFEFRGFFTSTWQHSHHISSVFQGLSTAQKEIMVAKYGHILRMFSITWTIHICLISTMAYVITYVVFIYCRFSQNVGKLRKINVPRISSFLLYCRTMHS